MMASALHDLPLQPAAPGLQDLSTEDAGELRAFLEKRRWFEGKLKSLESLPPIYPFLHPELIGSASDPEEFAYAPPHRSSYTLPGREEIVQWQHDRDAVEEEVLAFDGGDLSRMKEKTREVTLVPLTKPSTDLVAITLDLILLIDRLLTLLRHRSELLDLTSLRLDWDRLRWKAMRECEQVKRDIAEFASGAGVWQPTEERHAADNGQSTQQQAPSGDAAIIDRASGAGTVAEPTTPPPIHSTLPSTPQSPTASLSRPSLDSPRTDMRTRSPLVQSLYAIQDQYHAISTSTLKRSAAVLDRMIDVAGPLKGLGGVDGPSSGGGDGGDGGALPERFLDMQDDLETMVDDVKSRVQFCKMFRVQWDRSETHYTSSQHAMALAEETTSALRSALSQPATSSQHAALSQMLIEAEQAIPPLLDLTFPNPAHAAYPSTAMRTVHIKNTLTRGRAGASEACQRTRYGVEWYGRVADLRPRLEAFEGESRSANAQISALLDKIDITPETLHLAAGGAYEDRLVEVEEGTRDLEQSLDGYTRLAQESSVASRRYQTLLTDPSTTLQQLRDGAAVYPDNLQDVINRESNQLFAAVKKASEAIVRARDNVEIGRAAKRVSACGADVSGLEQLRCDLEQEIRSSLWNSGGGKRTNRSDLSHRVGEMRVQAEKAAQCANELDRLLVVHKRDRGAWDAMIGDAKRFGERVNHNTELLKILEAVREQAESVEALDTKGARLLDRIAALECGSEREQAGADVASQGIAAAVREWTDSISSKVRFVAPISGDTDSTYSDDVQPVDQFGLVDIDRAVRQHVNELSSRVSAALETALTPSLPDSPIVNDGAAETTRDRITKHLVTSATIGGPAGDMAGTDSARGTAPVDVFGSMRSSSPASALFGPDRSSIPPSAGGSNELSIIRHLRRRIKYMHIQDLAFPSQMSMQKTPSMRSIASFNVVSRIAKELLDIASRADALHPVYDGGDERGEVRTQHEKLAAKLTSAQAFLPRLEALAAFDQAAREADKAFGEVMTAIESHDLTDTNGSGAASTWLDGAAMALRTAESAAQAVESDSRVVGEMKRLRAVWADISAAAGHADGDDDGVRASGSGRQSVMSDLSFDSVSVPASVNDDDPSEAETNSLASARVPVIRMTGKKVLPRLGPSTSALPRADTALNVRAAPSSSTTQRTPRDINGTVAIRAASNPFPRLARTTESYRNRTLSGLGPDVGKVRQRQDSNASLGSVASDIATAKASTPTSRIPKPSRMPGAPTPLALHSVSSPFSVASDSGTSRVVSASGLNSRRVGAAKSIAKAEEAPAYKADPKSTLDRAVGKIVNRLKMSVPIVPVNIDGTDDWKDQSGRYWIGGQGRAKLCFCRILRSRTVMVRVGGGWVELSKFLLDHFAETVWQVPFEDFESPAPAPVAYAPNEPIVLTAASLAVQQQPDQTSPAKSQLHNTATPTATAAHPGTISIASSLDVSPAKAPSPVSPSTPVRITAYAIKTPTFSTPRSIHAATIGAGGGTGGMSRSSSFGMPGSTGSTIGPGSPLIAQHFIRKASESPPVREREKERLGVGRRSILGKEGAVVVRD